jgi:hypothetical protein
VIVDVEEVRRGQVRVALGDLGVEAVGLDRQLDGGRYAEVERALVAVEFAL